MRPNSSNCLRQFSIQHLRKSAYDRDCAHFLLGTKFAFYIQTNIAAEAANSSNNVYTKEDKVQAHNRIRGLIKSNWDKRGDCAIVVNATHL